MWPRGVRRSPTVPCPALRSRTFDVRTAFMYRCRSGPEREKSARKFESTRPTARRRARYSDPKSLKRVGRTIPKYSPISAFADTCRLSNGVSIGMTTKVLFPNMFRRDDMLNLVQVLKSMKAETAIFRELLRRYT